MHKLQATEKKAPAIAPPEMRQKIVTQIKDAMWMIESSANMPECDSAEFVKWKRQINSSMRSDGVRIKQMMTMGSSDRMMGMGNES